MNELALFAGAGGGILGSILLGHRTVCAVEVDPYCREVLLRRQEDGSLSPFPIWDDVRTFDGEPWRGAVDLISAGFPCQPFSAAGLRRSNEDSRNLWPETIRIIREVRPSYAFLENVQGLLSAREKTAEGDKGERYFGTILHDLAKAGYDAVWTVLGADDCGAPHRRKRIWVLAYSNCCGLRDKRGRRGSGRQSRKDQTVSTNHGAEKYVAHAQGDLRRASRNEGPEALDRGGADVLGGWWAAEPDMGRMADGVAYRVDRLKALGNGQVSIVAARAFWELVEIVEGNNAEF